MSKGNGSLSLYRVSLAFAGLQTVPKLITYKIARKIHFLDLSHNCIKDLSFLIYFHQLETLILDRNSQLDHKTLPPMMNLRVLWLNNCNIVNVQEWLQQLQKQCPHLRELSMMCNPIGTTQLNGFTAADERNYRFMVASILPQLEYFDGTPLTNHEPQQSIIQQIFSMLLT